MPSQGPNGAGTGADGGGAHAWSNPGNITAEDATNATASLLVGQNSNSLQATNFGFSIPAGATINGILVEIKRSASAIGLMKDVTVQLSLGGDNKADTVTTYPTSLTFASYGGSSDTWNASPTVSNVNASSFGVNLVTTDGGVSGGSANVDFVRITVTYTPVSVDVVPCTIVKIPDERYLSEDD